MSCLCTCNVFGALAVLLSLLLLVDCGYVFEVLLTTGIAVVVVVVAVVVAVVVIVVVVSSFVVTFLILH